MMGLKKQYGFGIIGAGMISHIHAMAIQAIPGANVTGVYNINKTKADQFAEKHNCKSFATIEEMANHPDIDVVCVCTPSGLHLEPALACIAAGKHCIIEKPLEITLERCDAIIEAAEKKGVKVAVIFNSRFYEASQLIKCTIEESRFGNLVLGDAYVKWHRSDAYYKSSPWRGTWKLDGGGALMNQGIHSVDLLQWYMGPVTSVQAFSANRQHKNIEVEDTVVASLQFASGALGSIEASTAVYPGSLKQIEIMGTEGTAVLQESNILAWDFLHHKEEDREVRERLMRQSVGHGGGASNPADISFMGHQKQIEDMIMALERGGQPLVDGIEGRKSVEIVLAVYKSAQSGKIVYL